MYASGVVPEHLGVLNLSFNKLKVLPAALGKSPVLQQMYLANNLLTDLPGSFSQVRDQNHPSGKNITPT